MMLQFIADTHFDSPRIAMARGYKDANEHDTEVLRCINTCVVPKRDRLYIVGDFCSKQAHKWRQKINCKEVTLIRGNHDTPAICKAFGKGHLFDGRTVMVRPGIKVFLSHYPHAYWPGSHHGSARNKVYLGDMHLYGHVHGEWETVLDGFWPERRASDCSVDNCMKLFGLPRPWSEHDLLTRLWAGRRGHHLIGPEWREPEAEVEEQVATTRPGGIEIPNDINVNRPYPYPLPEIP
jgi:calcineurin-like phosphoesterase family protein